MSLFSTIDENTFQAKLKILHNNFMKYKGKKGFFANIRRYLNSYT